MRNIALVCDNPGKNDTNDTLKVQNSEPKKLG